METGNKRVIAISSLVTIGVMILANLEKGQTLPPIREWLGFVSVFTLISILSDLKVPIAGGLALTVMVAMLVLRGEDAFGFALRRLEGADDRALRRAAKERGLGAGAGARGAANRNNGPRGTVPNLAPQMQTV